MNLLLISSSKDKDGRYLGHCKNEIKYFLNSCPDGYVLFIPYALHDLDAYASLAGKFFKDRGFSFKSIHELENPLQNFKNDNIKAIFTGGGNTFRLIKTLQDKKLLSAIKEKVENGTGYMGTSAGSNIACPTIMTTNDMPIARPKDFNALGLVDFQINPHFVPGSLIKNHRGETREERIKEYHEENSRIVIGLPEASWIRVQGSYVMLGGKADATVFKKDTVSSTWLMGAKVN